MPTSLSVNTGYSDPESLLFEIVERKGLGHPDTLADGLANAISVRYSKYCLENFGVILHHNVDKVYIGGGMFLSEFGSTRMVQPIRVVVNGRMSNEFAGNSIDIEGIAATAVRDYLGQVLPEIDTDTHLDIVVNSTQNMPNMNNPNWYCPRNISDLPEAKALYANDTSVCVAHAPRTKTESLTYGLEAYFRESGSLRPRFADYGQDIKVMAVREQRAVAITMCVPVMANRIANLDDYYEKVREIEQLLQIEANSQVEGTGLRATVKVNPSNADLPRLYILGIGSCVEGGEEGVVGRGNDNNGVISVFRAHSVEAPNGKNPKYHTGRVLGYLTTKLANKIYSKLGVKCTVLALTENGMSLVPPSRLIIQLDREIAAEAISDQIETNFTSVDYVDEILKREPIF